MEGTGTRENPHTVYGGGMNLIPVMCNRPSLSPHSTPAFK
jgi:hypothetical protein